MSFCMAVRLLRLDCPRPAGVPAAAGRRRSKRRVRRQEVHMGAVVTGSVPFIGLKRLGLRGPCGFGHAPPFVRREPDRVRITLDGHQFLREIRSGSRRFCIVSCRLGARFRMEPPSPVVGPMCAYQTTRDEVSYYAAIMCNFFHQSPGQCPKWRR